MLITARPSPADEARARTGCTGCFRRGALFGWTLAPACEGGGRRCLSAGRLPIVVGGTGLYLKALLEGLADVPPIPAEIRAEAEALYAEVGGAAFRHELGRLDPEGAKRIAAGDRQRLVRAFEVRARPASLSDWQQRCSTPAAGDSTERFATIALMPSRPRLYPTLDARFESMLAAGAIDEVGALLALGLDPGLPAMKAWACARSVRTSAARAPRAGDEVGEAGDPPVRQAAVSRGCGTSFRPILWLNEQYSESIRLRTFSIIRHAIDQGRLSD